MAAVTSELMFIAWRQIQADVVGFMDVERETRGAIRAIRIELGRLLRSMHIYATLVQLETRPDHVAVQLEVARKFRDVVSRRLS